MHAASVGETLAALPLIEALADADLANFLVTTGTVTSAEVLQRRLPPTLRSRVRHRYAPLDVPGWTARFLDGWRPNLGVLLEQELWPNLLAMATARGIPLALVNARMSARSARGWRRAPSFARALLGHFGAVLARTAEDAERLRSLGVPAEHWGDLKAAAPPLPHDAAVLARLRADTTGPVWLAASTHPGEEALVLAAHAALLGSLPALRLVIVPRHPQRGPAVAALAHAAGLSAARRAAAEPWPPPGGVYVADTLAELGLWYRLAGVALVGGSLVPIGGHNPLEPARLGCPILFGPHTDNFAVATADLQAAGGARRVAATAEDVAAAVSAVLADPRGARAMTEAASGLGTAAVDLPARTAQRVLALLELHANRNAYRSGDAAVHDDSATSLTA